MLPPAAAATKRVATALKNLERSEVLRDAFGGPLIDAFVAAHRHEVETCADRPTAKIAEELRWRS
jgi:glutamine synthetase